jgi:sugar-phosphatase
MMWCVSQQCQIPEPFAIAVSGVAGSGKSTLGRAIAKSLRAPLIDLDSVTNPLLEELPAAALGGHWLSSPYGPAIREGRYAALRATARDALAAAGRAVLVAPFTAELTGGPEWQVLCQAVAPAEPKMIQLVGDPELLAARRARRGEPRDRHRSPDPDASPPAAVPVITIDAELTTDQQLAALWPRLGCQLPLDLSNPLLGSRLASSRCSG